MKSSGSGSENKKDYQACTAGRGGLGLDWNTGRYHAQYWAKTGRKLGLSGAAFGIVGLGSDRRGDVGCSRLHEFGWNCRKGVGWWPAAMMMRGILLLTERPRGPALTRTGLAPAGSNQLILTHPHVLDGLE